ncbi:BrnT family toxin [Amygdalobacter nucleatus]|nr:BrnT family toxin [Amygdalobacter nucleatus]
MGLVREIVVVVYICRDPSIRIISARKANEKEIRRYQDGY